MQDLVRAVQANCWDGTLIKEAESIQSTSDVLGFATKQLQEAINRLWHACDTIEATGAASLNPIALDFLMQKIVSLEAVSAGLAEDAGTADAIQTIAHDLKDCAQALTAPRADHLQ